MHRQALHAGFVTKERAFCACGGRVNRQHCDTVSPVDGVHAKALDQGAFACAGNACDAEPLSDSVWAVGSTKKFFVAGLVLGQRAFHPGDGLSEGIAFAGQHSRGKRFSRP